MKNWFERSRAKALEWHDQGCFQPELEQLCAVTAGSGLTREQLARCLRSICGAAAMRLSYEAGEGAVTLDAIRRDLQERYAERAFALEACWSLMEYYASATSDLTDHFRRIDANRRWQEEGRQNGDVPLDS